MTNRSTSRCILRNGQQDENLSPHLDIYPPKRAAGRRSIECAGEKQAHYGSRARDAGAILRMAALAYKAARASSTQLARSLFNPNLPLIFLLVLLCRRSCNQRSRAQAHAKPSRNPRKPRKPRKPPILPEAPSRQLLLSLVNKPTTMTLTLTRPLSLIRRARKEKM